MEENKKAINEYDFGLTKADFIIVLVIFGGLALFMGYITINAFNWITLTMTLMCLSFCIAAYWNCKVKRKIITYDDSITLPTGVWSKKTRTVMIDEIEEGDETNQNGIFITNIKVKGDKKPIFIQQTHMDEVEFFEFQDWLLEKIKASPKTRNRIAKEEPKLKSKIVVWLSMLFAPTILLLTRYINGGLRDVKDWSLSLGLIGALFVVLYLRSKVKQVNEEEYKRLVKKRADPMVRKKIILWQTVFGILCLVSIILGVLAVKLFSNGDNLSIWLFFYYSLGLTLITLYSLHKKLPSVVEFVGKSNMYSSYVLVGAVVSIGFTFVFGTLNIELDKSEGRQRVSQLTGKYKVKKGKRRTCYKVSHWEIKEEFNESSVCNDKYPHLKDDDQVRYISHKGYFNVPWIKEVKLLR